VVIKTGESGKLHRMARAYVDGLIHQDEYTRQKKLLELSLESLVVPDYNSAEEAGNLIMNLPSLWESATLTEKRKLLITMLDAVYIDAKKSRSIIAIKPKPPFKPILQVAVSRKESNIRILKEPLDCSSNGSSVFLVETGESRTPRPEKAVIGYTTGLVGSYNLGSPESADRKPVSPADKSFICRIGIRQTAP